MSKGYSVAMFTHEEIMAFVNKNICMMWACLGMTDMRNQPGVTN